MQTATDSSVGARPEVALYLMPGCGICYQVKGYLARHGIPVELRWVTEPEHEAWALEHCRRHARSLPLLKVGEEVLQGYQPSQMKALLEQAGFEITDRAAQAVDVPSGDLGLPEEALWVTNFVAGSLSFVDPGTGARLADDLPLGPESNPVCVAHDPENQIVAVSDMGRHRVVFFDQTRGRFLEGSIETSSLATPGQLGDIVFDRNRHRFYVGSVAASVLLSIDSPGCRFTHGSAERSAVPIGPFTGGLALDESLDRLWVRVAEGLVPIDLERFAIAGDSLESARVAVPGGRNIALDPLTHRVLAALPSEQAVAYIDGRSGCFAFGSLEASRVETDRTPFALAVDSKHRRIYVSCLGSQRMQVLDADAPQHTGLPALKVGGASRSLALLDDDVLAVSSFDEGRVSFVSTLTNRYLEEPGGGALSATVGEGPRGIAFVGRETDRAA